MPQVADHLAELTGFRDRDVLDTTLVGVLRELLRPLAVTVCHRVGDGAKPRWLVRARLLEGDVAASADSVWAELEDLPRLEDYPARLECLRKQEPVEVPGVTHVTCFPLLTDLDAVGVLEVLPLSWEAALLAGQLRALLPAPPTGRSAQRDRGAKPERRVAWIADIQIAATAWLAGEPVCTADREHFETLSKAIAELFPREEKLQVIPPPQPVGS